MQRGRRGYLGEGEAWHFRVGCRGMIGRVGSSGLAAACPVAARACPASFEPSAAAADSATAPTEHSPLSVLLRAGQEAVSLSLQAERLPAVFAVLERSQIFIKMVWQYGEACSWH